MMGALRTFIDLFRGGAPTVDAIGRIVNRVGSWRRRLNRNR